MEESRLGASTARAALRDGHSETSAHSKAERETTLNSAFVAAWTELGYADDADQGHLFTARQAGQWGEAVLRALGDQSPAESLAGLADDAVHKLGRLVAATLVGDDSPALHLIATLKAADADDGGRTTTAFLSILLGWLAGARESGAVDLEAVTAWLNASLGRHAAGITQTMTGILGHQAETLAETHYRLGPMFAPALIWLAAGTAATAGGGDPSWLMRAGERR